MSTAHSWPPALTEAQEGHLLSLASDYSLANGLVLRPPAPPGSTPSTTMAIHAPYSLLPSPFPASLFEQAKDLQPLYNALYAHVTVDDAFLDEVVGGAVAKVDEFQGQLYKLWKKVSAEGIKQDLHLGLFRSDYLVHSPQGGEASIKQVEFNTISSSFGPLATKVGEMHSFLRKAGAYPDHPLLSPDEAIPTNNALAGLAAGLAAGHHAYADPSAKILFVVQDHERNAFDQRAIEFELLDTHSIGVIRLPFATLHEYATLSPTGTLLITHPSLTHPTPISVVYYRSGYTPTDYPSQTQWSTRLLLERSTAIKCPTLALQLAGCKKVQQVLAAPCVLDQFLHVGSTVSSLSPPPIASLDLTHAAQLLTSFTSLYPLDDSEMGKKALSLAYAHPERFVLKPQREGGGNNIYRLDIPPFLDSLATKDLGKNEGEPREREGYILMDLILPPEGMESIMVRAGEEKGSKGEVVSELGVYGVMLFRKGDKGAEVLVNVTTGHLLRTKGKDSDEGGVAVGFSVIDSPLLV